MRYWFFILQIFFTFFTFERAEAYNYEYFSDDEEESLDSKYFSDDDDPYADNYNNYDNDDDIYDDSVKYESDNLNKNRPNTRNSRNSRYYQDYDDDDDDYDSNYRYSRRNRNRNYYDDDEEENAKQKPDDPVSSYIESLSKLKEDYQITGYNLYKLLGKNSPVGNSTKKKIDEYFGINTGLLNTLDLIINKKDYPSLYLSTENPQTSNQDQEDSDENPAKQNSNKKKSSNKRKNKGNKNSNKENDENSQNSPTDGDKEVSEISDPAAVPPEDTTNPNVPAQPTDPNQQTSNTLVPATGATTPQSSVEESSDDDDDSEEEKDDEDKDDEDSEENNAEEQPTAGTLIPLNNENTLAPLDSVIQESDILNGSNLISGTASPLLNGNVNSNIDSVMYQNDSLNNNQILNNGKDKTLNSLLMLQLAKDTLIGNLDRYNKNKDDVDDWDDSNFNQSNIDSTNMYSDKIRPQENNFEEENLAEQQDNVKNKLNYAENDRKIDAIQSTGDELQNDRSTEPAPKRFNNAEFNKNTIAREDIEKNAEENSDEPSEDFEEDENDEEESTSVSQKVVRSKQQPQRSASSKIQSHRQTSYSDDETESDDDQSDESFMYSDTNSDQNDDVKTYQTNKNSWKTLDTQLSSDNQLRQQKASNPNTIQRFLNGNHKEIITGDGVEPMYLNAFDPISTQTNATTSQSDESTIVRHISKTPEQKHFQLIPDSSDGKLHVNHF